MYIIKPFVVFAVFAVNGCHVTASHYNKTQHTAAIHDDSNSKAGYLPAHHGTRAAAAGTAEQEDLSPCSFLPEMMFCFAPMSIEARMGLLVGKPYPGSIVYLSLRDI